MKINYKQKLVIIASAFIIGLMGIFPPWNFVSKTMPNIIDRDAGYHFILKPPIAYRTVYSNHYMEIREGLGLKKLGRKEGEQLRLREKIQEEETYLRARIDFERLLVQSLIVIFLGFGVGIFLNLEKGKRN